MSFEDVRPEWVIVLVIIYWGWRINRLNLIAAEENEKRLNRIIELLERRNER